MIISCRTVWMKKLQQEIRVNWAYFVYLISTLFFICASGFAIFHWTKLLFGMNDTHHFISDILLHSGLKLGKMLSIIHGNSKIYDFSPDSPMETVIIFYANIYSVKSKFEVDVSGIRNFHQSIGFSEFTSRGDIQSKMG